MKLGPFKSDLRAAWKGSLVQAMKGREERIGCESRRRKAGLAVAWLMSWVLLPTALALDPAESVLQYNCRTWTAQNGFPAFAVNAITQTKDGFVWIGTQKGIVRFDGEEFKLLRLPQNRLFQYQVISCLCAADDGGLWFGIQNGAFGMYRDGSGFTTPTNQAWVTPEMKVSALLKAHDGSLWIGSGAGVIHWGNGTNTVQSLNFAQAQCLAMFQDAQGRIWFSILGRGVFIYDGHRLISFPDPTLEKNNTIVFGIAEDREGQFWFATQSGVRVYDADFHPRPGPSINSKILCILVDREGTVWMGSDGDGLFCWRHGRLTNLRKSNGLADNHVTALYEDHEGNLWVGTRGGLSLLSNVKFPLYTPEGAGQGAAFHSVCPAAGGGIWAGSSVGLFRFDGGHFTYYGPQNAGLSSYWLKQVFQARDGDVYLANGSKEVEIFHGGKVVARHQCSTWQTGFAEDRQGVVMGVGDQLFRVSRSRLTPYVFTHGSPEFGWIRSLNSTRDGTILVASVDGLFLVKNGEYKQFTTENGLSGNEVLWACEDANGVIWAGLSDGVARIKGNRVDSWTRANGLYDNYVRSIIPDNEGWLWMDSDSGIFRVRRGSFIVDGHKAEHLKCEVFNTMDAVKTLDTADVEFSACKSRAGRIWIPSPQGLILIDPEHLLTNPPPPQVHVESIRVNGRKWSSADGLTVPPGKGELEVQYTAPTFINPQKQQFRYKLEGYESRWQNAGTRRSAFYTNLKPGKYRFVVEACSANGSAAGKPDSFAIELLPFYYQTAGFRILCGGLVVVLLAGIYAWRISFWKRKQQVIQASRDRLELEVQHRTAELKERAVLLENEIENRKKMEQEVERTHRKLLEASRLAGMTEVATGVLHNVGNILNSINISATQIGEVLQRLRIGKFSEAAQLIADQDGNLPDFLKNDPRGRALPGYLQQLAGNMTKNEQALNTEVESLVKQIDHVKAVVAWQQDSARSSGIVEELEPRELMEDALQVNLAAYERHKIEVVRDYEKVPRLNADRHKILQILINLLNNAKYAVEESQTKRVTLRLRGAADWLRFEISDTGMGISAENLGKIFTPGFTTRAKGHGFGLHSGANAAKEMAGRLFAASDGPGHGATFVLELPHTPARTVRKAPAMTSELDSDL